MFAVELGSHATGAHAQEGEEPVDDVEQHAAYRDGSDVGGIAEMSDDGHVHQSQQRDGDVRHDGRQGDVQYVLVYSFHLSSVFV